MYKVENNAEPFEFEVGGKAYAVPTMQNLPLKTFREIQKTIRSAKDGTTEETAVYALLDMFESLAPGCTDTLTFAQALELMKAYTSFNGESLGES